MGFLLLTKPSCWVKVGRALGQCSGKKVPSSSLCPQSKTSSNNLLSVLPVLASHPNETKTRNTHHLLDRSSFFLMGWHWEPSRINLLRPPESWESRAEAIREFMKMNVRMTSACSIFWLKLCPKPARWMAACVYHQMYRTCVCMLVARTLCTI